MAQAIAPIVPPGMLARQVLPKLFSRARRELIPLAGNLIVPFARKEVLVLLRMQRLSEFVPMGVIPSRVRVSAVSVPRVNGAVPLESSARVRLDNILLMVTRSVTCVPQGPNVLILTRK